jgi:hypothetical protein
VPDSLRPDANSDWYTVAAIGLTAMCVTTVDHEALGHGGMCLAIGGHITVLTSSVFRCNVHSVWIDPAGPFANVLAGTVSLLMATRIPRHLTALRLLLTLVTSFSFFWEAGYLIKAMLDRHGDLYFTAEDFLGEPSLWWRITGIAIGVVLYWITVRWVSRSLAGLFPNTDSARRAARVAWAAATVGTALAALPALAHAGGELLTLKDAVLEIGAASFPLLFIPRKRFVSTAVSRPTPICRSGLAIGLSLTLYLFFIITLGRGLYF